MEAPTAAGWGIAGSSAPATRRRRLAEMGHKVRPGVGAQGGYQGIWRKDGPLRYFGGSDPRGDGAAIGY